MLRCLTPADVMVVHKALHRAATVIRTQRQVLLWPRPVAHDMTGIDLDGLTDDLREWAIEMKIALNRIANADQTLRGRHGDRIRPLHPLRREFPKTPSASMARARRRFVPSTAPDLFKP